MKNTIFNVRSKHIDVIMNFIRYVIEKGEIINENISTNLNPLYAITKKLDI